MGMQLDDDQIEIIQEFVTESRDMIEQLEPAIIELGQNSDPETMNAIFRLFHSMKGSAGFLEFTHLTRVAHAAESLLDLVRNNEIELLPEHVTLFCAACDFAKDALDAVDASFSDDTMSAAADSISAQLHLAIDGPATSAADPQEDHPTTPVASEPEPVFPEMEITEEMRNSFVQESGELLQHAEQGLLAWGEHPEDADSIGDIFRHIHSFKGNCGFFGFAHLEKLSHQMENVLDRVKSGSRLAVDNPTEQLLVSLDLLQQGLNNIAEGKEDFIEDLDSHLEALKNLMTPLLGDLLAEEGVDKLAISSAVEIQKKPVGEILMQQGSATPEQIANALKRQQESSDEAKAKAKPVTRSKVPAKRQDIRVELGKLDNLINLIGEMVIAENMLIHNPDLKGLELENFGKAAQHMSKLVRELQEMAMSIRMIPVSGLFRRMIRLVHDISVKAGKKVDLQLIGEETEIDKTVIETITDPLVHLLRNSLDHGLEPPAERMANGKSEKGTVKLSARHEEGEVWVTIEDDGRGLNREKILEKAISKGLIEGDGSDLTEKQINNLIFAPGFSTAAQVTDISGRGVGMDVVKRNLEKIKGKIDITSKLGQGTRINLRIPLTLAIIDGMMVRVGTTTCIVPTLSILEAYRPEMEQITVTPDGDELARVREHFFPVVRLHQILNKRPDSEQLCNGILIVLEYQDSRFCLFVDEILGQQQTVIKGLSDFIGTVPGVSGCTILGDGGVSLILDVGTLVESFDSKKELADAAAISKGDE
ncbi:chemotaxis protein CheA [Pelovirga terrestris]|uniref:Chemotaxis protein CheA n=1 Tax=Pelovirga terrestris TaxID=2771352 RepID=A0A8J6UHK6_9BACT|nr:chemotaxis protein CheA [Pelovirga terrestris]MBD1401593.1 chemotaxis protein CheA [Pelovirga terrestris]